MRNHNAVIHTQRPAKPKFKPTKFHELLNPGTITVYVGPDAWAAAEHYSKVSYHPDLLRATGNYDPLADIDGHVESEVLVITGNELADKAKLSRVKRADERTHYIYLVSHGAITDEQTRDLISVFRSQAPKAKIYLDDNPLGPLEEIMVESGVLELGCSVGDDASAIASQIKAGLTNKLASANPDHNALTPDTSVIEKMINGSFWSGQKSKLFMLNLNGSLNQFSSVEAFKFLTRTFGSVVDDAAVEALAQGAMADEKKSELRRFKTELNAVIRDPILDYIKDTCQRESISWMVDMFDRDSTVKLTEDKALITLSHKPLEANTLLSKYEPSVIADYKQHFTRFDEFLEFLVMARFAQDRKKAYLWINADSDWGKGFLKSMLNNLGLAVELSVREIELIFGGGPVAKSPADFRRAFALVVDEFKNVKSEIKQLESTIRISPKNQLQSEVEIFAKIFLSAEHVASLAGENGVEDQFANRMSIFKESGSIDKRPLFREIGSAQYLSHITLYAAEFINSKVKLMRSMGRLGAATESDVFLNAFIKRNGIDTIYERFSDSLPVLADSIIDWAKSPKAIGLVDVVRHSDATYLRSANKAIGTYINEYYDRSEGGSLHHKKDAIAKLMSMDGSGIKTHKVNGKAFKGIRLK